MTVEFVLDLPPLEVAERTPAQDFAGPVPAKPLLSGDERRHRELLASLNAIRDEIDTLDVEVPALPPLAPLAPAGVDYGALALALRDALGPLLSEQQAALATSLDAVAERLKTLSKQVIASAGGPSGGSGSVMVRNDASNPAFFTATNPGLTRAQLDSADVGVQINNLPEARDLSVASATVTPGSPLTVTPTAGQKLRVWWVNVTSDPDNTGTGKAVVTLAGKGDIYRAYDVGHRQRFDGSTNGTLSVTSDEGTYEVTVHYEQIA